MTNRVFVYGSLSEGMVHFDRIKAAVATSIRAWALGAAYQLRTGYPVLVQEGAQRVSGFLVELKSPDLMIPLLDGFYGFAPLDSSKSLHFREQQVFETELGEQLEAWVYYLNPKKLPSTAQLIENGDWEAQMQGPKFTDQLTDRQKIYIRRLGAVTGREVVPIDLSLYRELMNLELIVDKGRRLALSKFGQEGCRYRGDT